MCYRKHHVSSYFLYLRIIPSLNNLMRYYKWVCFRMKEIRKKRTCVHYLTAKFENQKDEH